MIRHIPPKGTKRWTGPYSGSYYGSLWKTFNVDLDRNEGWVELSQRFERIEDSTELTDLSGDSSQVLAFLKTDADCTDRYWALSPAALFKTDSDPTPEPSRDWDTDGLDSSPTANMNDFIVHGNDSRNDSGRNKLFVTTDTDIAVLNDTGNSAWTRSWWVGKQSQPPLDSSVNHPIEYFTTRKITLVGDRNMVHTISRPSDTQNDTVTRARLILPQDLVVQHIIITSERAWICCYNRKLEKGAIAEWDGFAQSANRIHEIYGMGAIAGVNYAGSPIVLDNVGTFLEFTGNSFVPMRRGDNEVSLFSRSDPGFGLSSFTTMAHVGNFAVHWKGMAVGEDGLIYANFPGFFTSGYGNPERNLAGIWCLNPITGRLYNKYSLSRSDSNDYGQQVGSPDHPGGLMWVSNDILFAGRNLLAGGTVNDTTDNHTNGIWLLNDLHSNVARGSFITQFIPADEVREFWDSLWVRYRSVTVDGSIIVKAKGTQSLIGNDGSPLDRSITWTSTATFTVNLNSADNALAVGDEGEVLSGTSAGITFHIAAISGAHSAVQTITIDESIGSSSGTSTVRFDRWKKIGTITNTAKYEQKMNIGIDSSFIQFKVELRSAENPSEKIGVSDLIVTSKSSINLEN